MLTSARATQPKTLPSRNNKRVTRPSNILQSDQQCKPAGQPTRKGYVPKGGLAGAQQSAGQLPAGPPWLAARFYPPDPRL